MNESTENLITLKVEGIESEHGHVRADEFIDEMSRLLTVLNGVDRMVGETGQPTLYYRIVAVSHSSPLSITLEPVIRRNIKKPSKDHVAVRHHRFFRELTAIRKNEPVSQELDEQVLENLVDLTGSLGRNFKSVTISNQESRVELDSVFEQNIKKLLDEEDSSYGGVEGRLDAVNIHGQARRFWIYPTIGAPKIRCDFLPGTAQQLRDALGNYVRVEGIKHFRPQSPFPFRVSVRDFEVVSDLVSVHLKDMGGMAKATQDLSSVDFVRRMRDEWD